MNFYFHRLVGWCCALLATPAVLLATPEGADSLTLDRVVELVLEYSPALQAAGYDSQAAAARIEEAMLAPPLRAGLELENFAGTGNQTERFDALEATLSLSRVLEMGDKPRLRGEFARQEADMLRDEQDAERLDLLAEAARRFLQVVADQERLRIARDATKLAGHTVAIVERRVSVGKTPTAERSKARIAHSRTELDLEHAQHQLASSRLLLATTWGDTKAAFPDARATLFGLPVVESFEQLERHLERNPDLVLLATAERVGEAREQLARAGRKPDIEVAAGVRYLNKPDDAVLVVQATVPLGTRRRAKPGMEEARALTLREPHLFKQRYLELYATLFSLHQELVHSRTLVETLRDRIIPEASRALGDYETGYAAGRYSFLELADAQRSLLTARSEAITAAADYHRFRIEIDRLTGGVTLNRKVP